MVESSNNASTPMSNAQSNGASKNANERGTTPSTSLDIPQVLGLVPLFACCSNIQATGTTTFARSNRCTLTLSIIIGGVNYGSTGVSMVTTTAALQATINGFLAGTGITASVTSNQFIYITITFLAPNNTGSAYNGVVIACTVTGCGKEIRNINFAGGGTNCDCRDGYDADEIPDDRNFVLPVFGDPYSTSTYNNDFNTFALNYQPGYTAVALNTFNLQKLSGTSWSTVSVLKTTALGIPIIKNCLNFNYQGYTIDWKKVLLAFGEGTYRMYVSGPCAVSPPFCLKTFSCEAADQTVKFEISSTGGTYGSVTKQGQSFSLCCQTASATETLSYSDSIRFAGFFGYETAEFARDYIKYASGFVNHVRDEAIKSFILKTDPLPLWLHQRLYAYAFQSQEMYVNDYNTNNANYNLKHFGVIADSGYTPNYKTYSRYMRVQEMRFKEQTQFVYKDRCCG